MSRRPPTISWGVWRRSSASGRRRSSTTNRPWPSTSSSTPAMSRRQPTISLGMVAQEQRQWAQAEQYYQQALAIYIEFNDRYAQAATYHQLGMCGAGAAPVGAGRAVLPTGPGHQNRVQRPLCSRRQPTISWGGWRRSSASGRRQRQDLLTSLQTYVAFKDEHNLGIVLRSLARLWRDSGDVSLAGRRRRSARHEPAEVERLFAATVEEEGTA